MALSILLVSILFGLSAAVSFDNNDEHSLEIMISKIENNFHGKLAQMEIAFNEKLLRIEKLVEDKNGRIEHLENTVASYRAKNRELEERLDIQKRYLLELETKQRCLEDYISELKYDVSHLKEKVENMSVLETTNDSMLLEKGPILNPSEKRAVPGNSDILRSSRMLLPNPTDTTKSVVGFYAYTSQREIKPSLHHTLVFDVVKTNTGGYNPISGIFTVPRDGYYTFWFSTHVYCHSFSILEIMRNTEVEESIIADAQEICDNDYASGTIFIFCHKGDIVYVRTHSVLLSQGDILSSPTARVFFGGWLIG